jgi:hypothetical protein
MSRSFRSCGSRVYSQYLTGSYIFQDSNLHVPPRILITGLYNLSKRNKQNKELISSDQAVQGSLLTSFGRGIFQDFKGFSFVVFTRLMLQTDVTDFTFLAFICCNLWANCLENVGASTSHKPIGVHGLLQGQLYLSLEQSSAIWRSVNYRMSISTVTTVRMSNLTRFWFFM